jgi:hypothetical protein
MNVKILMEGKCHTWIIDHFKSGEYSKGKDQPDKKQIDKADKICSDFPNFKKRIPLNHTLEPNSFLGKVNLSSPNDKNYLLYG